VQRILRACEERRRNESPSIVVDADAPGIINERDCLRAARCRRDLLSALQRRAESIARRGGSTVIDSSIDFPRDVLLLSYLARPDIEHNLTVAEFPLGLVESARRILAEQSLQSFGI